MAVICLHKTFWEETAYSLGRKPKTARGEYRWFPISFRRYSRRKESVMVSGGDFKLEFPNYALSYPCFQQQD